MKSNYDKGIAFIMEGDTEYQFYDALLLYFERQHPDCHLMLVSLDPISRKSGDKELIFVLDFLKMLWNGEIF